MSKPINTLMQKEMTRSEFLSTLGLGMLSVFGFSAVIELLTGKSIHHRITQNFGYSSGDYGGTKNKQVANQTNRKLT